MAAALSLLLLAAAALPSAAAARPLNARELLVNAVSSPPAPSGPCYSRVGYGRRADGSATPVGDTVAVSGGPCSSSQDARGGISIFTLIWVVAGGMCLILLARIVRLRLLSPPEQAAAANGAGGGAAPSAEASWKVRYGVRVQQPDGAWVAGLEASLRAGLAHTASAMRRTAESLRGGRFTPGNSMHDASELLAMALARPPADGATLPPENWPGWRPAADVHSAQVPPALAALHDATTAAAAQAAPAAAATSAEEEARGRAGAEGTGVAAQQQATPADAGPP